MCSPWFGGHSIVKSLASQPRLKITVLIPALWWCKLFFMIMAKIVLCQETVEKGFFWQPLNCIVQLQEINGPFFTYWSAYIRPSTQTTNVAWIKLQKKLWQFPIRNTLKLSHKKKQISSNPHQCFSKLGCFFTLFWRCFSHV